MHDLGFASDGRLYFAMKSVRGKTLSAVARDQGVPLAARLEIFGKVCDAVAFAHSRGVIHRDLKPQNVMVGSYGRVYVLDWGVAKILDEDDTEGSLRERELDDDPIPQAEKTRDGVLVGTLSCMSPEQARGESAALDVRSDVYALGVMLYRLLANASPYGAQNKVELLDAVLSGRVLPLRRAAPVVPWELAAIVHKAMSHRPEGRYSTALALHEDIQRYQAQLPVHAARYSVWGRVRKWMGRNRGIVGAAGATAAVAGLVLTGSLVLWSSWLFAARNRAEQAEGAAKAALAESLVTLAQARADDGQIDEAVTLLTEAEERFQAAGASPLPATLQRAWMYRVAPPPQITWVLGGATATVSPGGDQLEIELGGRRTAIHDAHTGRVLTTYTLPDEAVWHGWAPRPTAVVRRDGALVAIDPTDGATLWSLTTDPEVTMVEVSYDGSTALAGNERQTTAYQVPTGEVLSDDLGSIFLSRLSNDGRYACTVTAQTHLRTPENARIRDLERDEIVLRPPDATCEPIAPDSDAVGFMGDGQVGVLELPSGAPRWHVAQSTMMVTFTPDGASLLIYKDGLVTALDAMDGSQRGQRRLYGGPSRSMGRLFPAAGGRAVLTTTPDAARLWTLPLDEPTTHIDLADSLTGLDVSADGELVATATFGGRATITHARSATPLLAVDVSPNGLRDVAFTPEGDALLAADREGRATLIPLDGSAISHYGRTDAQIAMAARAFGDRVLVLLESGVVEVYERGSGRHVASWPTGLRSGWGMELDLVRGRGVVAGRKHEDPSVAAFDLTTGVPLWNSGDTEAAYRVAVAPDGSLLVGNHLGQPMVVPADLSQGRLLPSLGEAVQGVAWSPDGTLLALGDYGARVTVLRTADMSEVLRFEAGTRAVVDMAIIGPEPLLIVGNGDGTVHLVDLGLAETVDAGALRVTPGHDPPYVSAVARAKAAAGTGDWARARDLLLAAEAEGEGIDPVALARAAWATGDAALTVRALERAVARAEGPAAHSLGLWLRVARASRR